MEMLRFISFQVSRTEKAKKLADDFVDKMFDKVLKPIMKSNKEIMSKITPEEVDKVRLVYPGAFLLDVVSSLEANILLTDLVPAVIINKTDQDFIFSDNPVIFYNLIYRDPTHSFEGYQSPGLIVFCPISSKKCLLLFDPVYYDIQLNKNKVEVTNKEDIKAINKLQFHNSCENIYYQSESQKSILDQLSKEYFERYTKEKDLAQIKEVPKWEGGNNSLLVTSKKGIPEKISLSFVKCGQHKQEVCVVRDAKLKELYDEKMKLYGIKK